MKKKTSKGKNSDYISSSAFLGLGARPSPLGGSGSERLYTVDLSMLSLSSPGFPLSQTSKSHSYTRRHHLNSSDGGPYLPSSVAN